MKTCMFLCTCTLPPPPPTPDVPHPPTHVSLHVTSSCSLNVRWAEPEDTNGAVVTRYRSKGAFLYARSFSMYAC